MSVIGAGHNLIHMCIYLAWQYFFFNGVFFYLYLYLYGKLYNVPRSRVLLSVRDCNMITLYAHETVTLIYGRRCISQPQGKYCEPKLTSTRFSLLCSLKLCRKPRNSGLRSVRTHSSLHLSIMKFYTDEKRKMLF